MSVWRDRPRTLLRQTRDAPGGGRRAGATAGENLGFGASPRDIARFLISLRPLVARAIEIRLTWIKQLGLLFEDARQGNTAQVTSRAGQVGRDNVSGFRDVRTSVERAQPPDGCQEIHRALLQWMDGLVKACESLVEVSSSGQLAGLQVAQRHVTDARHAARRFNGEYTRLVTELRVAVRAARRR